MREIFNIKSGVSLQKSHVSDERVERTWYNESKRYECFSGRDDCTVYIAIDYPELVEKLFITVLAARVNEHIHDGVASWIEFAVKGDHKILMIDTAKCKGILKFDAYDELVQEYLPCIHYRQ